MKHLFVSYEIAVMASEFTDKDFDDNCLAWYGRKFPQLNWDNLFIEKWDGASAGDKKCSAPLYQQIVDWFREKHNIHIEISESQGKYAFELHKSKHLKGVKEGGMYNNHYTALTLAITEAFKLINP